MEVFQCAGLAMQAAGDFRKWFGFDIGDRDLVPMVTGLVVRL
jgi:hypothetical protein